MDTTPAILYFVIAGLIGVIISMLIHNRAEKVDSRFKALKKKVNALESEVEDIKNKRQDHHTRAGLLDSQANLSTIEREVIELEARLAYIRQIISRNRDISGVLLNDPRSYPKEDRFDTD